MIGDGADYMLDDGKKFDYILVDGFDKGGRAGVLDTLALARQKFPGQRNSLDALCRRLGAAIQKME